SRLWLPGQKPLTIIGTAMEQDRGATRVSDDVMGSMMEVRAARVDVVKGPDTGRTARIDKPAFIIGAGASADLRLNDDLVSREHIRISLAADGVRIRDVGSTNGTWTGSTRIWDLMITSSITLTIGSTDLALRVEAAPVVLPLSNNDHFGSAIGTS